MARLPARGRPRRRSGKVLHAEGRFQTHPERARLEAELAPKPLVAPASLTPEQRTEFLRIAADAPAGFLNASHQTSVESLAILTVRLRELDKALEGEPMLVPGREGVMKRHPLLGQHSRTVQDMLRLTESLRLTPAAQENQPRALSDAAQLERDMWYLQDDKGELILDDKGRPMRLPEWLFGSEVVQNSPPTPEDPNDVSYRDVLGYRRGGLDSRCLGPIDAKEILGDRRLAHPDGVDPPWQTKRKRTGQKRR